MSNAPDIAAITAAIGKRLSLAMQSDLGNAGLTMRPPDSARQKDDSSNQLNLFLFRVSVNAARVGRPLSTLMRAPLPLDLSYLITAYSADDSPQISGPMSHLLLGKALTILHEHPVLLPDEMGLATGHSEGATSEPPISIDLLDLPVDVMAELWCSFRTPYRTSIACLAHSVLLGT